VLMLLLSGPDADSSLMLGKNLSFDNARDFCGSCSISLSSLLAFTFLIRVNSYECATFILVPIFVFGEFASSCMWMLLRS
jgi:hypothetical protein